MIHGRLKYLLRAFTKTSALMCSSCAAAELFGRTYSTPFFTPTNAQCFAWAPHSLSQTEPKIANRSVGACVRRVNAATKSFAFDQRPLGAFGS